MLWHYWGVLLSWYMKMKRKAIESSLQHAQPKWVFSVFSHPVKIQFISRSCGLQELWSLIQGRKSEGIFHYSHFYHLRLTENSTENVIEKY